MRFINKTVGINRKKKRKIEREKERLEIERTKISKFSKYCFMY